MRRALFPIALLVLAASCNSAQRGPTRAPQVVYEHAAVAADHVLASQAGVEMLRRGGNAVDAAVAASFCLSVVRPFSCGIGGGGFMVIYRPRDDAVGGGGPRAVAINFRETAPAAVGPDYYVRLGDERASRDGHHASGVPGTVAGLLWALEHYGALDRETVLGPAIRVAEEGFAADESHVRAAQDLAERLDRAPHLRDAAAYLWAQLCHGGEIEVGDLITNPDQARALRLIAADGESAFYEGPIADAIVECMATGGGPITPEDLADYRARAVQPLRGSFRGLDLLMMPPPSSGGVAMIQILGILERRLGDLRDAARDDPAYMHLFVEACKHAFADRAAWLADESFVDVPVRRLTSPDYLDERAGLIDMRRTQASARYGSAAAGLVEDGGTSHLSVVDADGMAVASSQTINLVYGSMVVVPGFGFALNDQMDDFTTVPGRPNEFKLRQSDRNLPEPGKRPLSSMSPTIVLKDGRAVVVAGASGGPRIITGTLQCILGCVLFDMTPAESVGAPRFHHQWLPDVLQFEAAWTDDDLAAMRARGHETGRRDEIAVVQLIVIGADGVRPASDPRKGGVPAGY